MQYEAVLLISYNEINESMSAVDLCPDGKFFVEECCITFKTTSEVSEEYFLNLIKKSKELKEENDFWIPGIIFCGALYKDDEVKEFSDGKISVLFSKE